jgi:environmental stress-induced protein Ves
VREHLKPADYQNQPWKNGGGVTTQLAIWPQSAAFPQEAFEWRISSATISGPGPFSAFPGYDRLLCIWSGGGLELNGQPLRDGQCLHFSGDQPTSCKLLAGPVKDLNVIYRRGLITAHYQRHELLTPVTLARKKNETLAVIGAEGDFEADGLKVTQGETLLLHAQPRAESATLRGLTANAVVFVFTLKTSAQAATLPKAVTSAE